MVNKNNLEAMAIIDADPSILRAHNTDGRTLFELLLDKPDQLKSLCIKTQSLGMTVDGSIDRNSFSPIMPIQSKNLITKLESSLRAH